MKVAICDDEAVYREDILEKCKILLNDYAVSYNCFSSGEELLETGIDFDYLFLDIEMKDMDGIHVKDLLEKRKDKCKIIFLTSHSERMIEAFGYNVIGFLTKPVKEELLIPIIAKIKEFNNNQLVEWEENGTYYAFEADDISYIEAQDKYTVVIVGNEKILVRRTLKKWEEILMNNDFCKVNRSYLVNLKLFDRISGEVKLNDGKIIRISRKDKSLIEEKYKAYIRKKMGDMVL